MIGYKVAIGIDKVKGPFPVIVVLEIPEDATVVVPTQKVLLDAPIDITKLRTDKAIVIDMYPLYREHTDLNWNGLAFSAYELTCVEIYYYDQKINTVYKIGKHMISDLAMDETESCGKGIHYFKSEEDARLYYSYDYTGWFYGILYNLKVEWDIESVPHAKDVMIRLSEMED